MGQRHQFFIVMPNPVKFDWAKHWDDLPKAKKALGNGKTTVIAIHHQWLYGRSPLVNLIDIMDYTDKELIQEYSSPFSSKVQVNSYEEWRTQLMMMLQVQTNKLHPRGLGIEHMYYLNDDDPNMRMVCDEGDNNDGITIIDTINRKYCFMNINNYSYEPEEGEKRESASDLVPYQPVSADAYVSTYYPKGGNKRVTKPLEKYDVLTLDEVKEIFPKMTTLDKEIVA